MDASSLSAEERRYIDTGAWFAKLSQALRNDILARAAVRRLKDGAALTRRGASAEAWCGVTPGAVRISSISLAGKQVALSHAEPGVWFGDIALFDSVPRTHGADAHGQTTLLCVHKPDFKALPASHVERYDALLRLMFDHFENLNTRALQVRLAKQIILLAKSYGIRQGEEIRIGLELAQEQLAQLLGASRQRVSQELKGFEREGAVRV